MLVMEDLDLPMLKRMEQSSEKRQVLVERELDSTATLMRVAKPSLSSTVLELMVSVSLRVPIFPMEPMVRTLLLMTPTIENQLQSNNNNSHSNHSSITTNSLSNNLNNNTTTMSNQHRHQLLSTHSLTQLTQHTQTLDTTQMLQSMLQVTLTPNRLPVCPHVLTVQVLTHLSTPMTPATNLAMSSLSSLLQDLSNSNSSPASITTITTTSSTPQRDQDHHSFLQEN